MQSKSTWTRSPTAKMSSSAELCSTSKRPAFTPAILPACCLRSISLSRCFERMREYTFKLARALKVVGLMNIQFAIPRSNGNGGDGGKVYVLEVNPRASRTVPYVSKATGVPMAKIAARLMTGRKLREFLPENHRSSRTDLDTGSCYYVKSPVFPWNKFPGVDTVLGPEMKSTGEVMGVADNFGEAFAKAQLAAGQKLPTQGAVFISVTDHDKRHVAEVARKFVDMGFKLVATAGTADVIEAAGMNVERVYKVKEGRPNVVDFIKGQRMQLDRQHADRARAVVRRKSDPPRRRDGAHSDDHDVVRRPRRCGGHRRSAAWRSECPRAAASTRGKSGYRPLVGIA